MLTVEKIGGTSMSQFQDVMQNIIVEIEKGTNSIIVYLWFRPITM